MKIFFRRPSRRFVLFLKREYDTIKRQGSVLKMSLVGRLNLHCMSSIVGRLQSCKRDASVKFSASVFDTFAIVHFFLISALMTSAPFPLTFFVGM